MRKGVDVSKRRKESLEDDDSETVDVVATMEVGALSAENKVKDLFIISSRQLVAGSHGAVLDVLRIQGRAKNPRYFTNAMEFGFPTAGGC